MRFTKMNEMPKFIRKPGARQLELIEFMNMETKCVKVTLLPGEYVSIESAYATLGTSAKRSGLPIEVRRKKGVLYLIRTDM